MGEAAMTAPTPDEIAAEWRGYINGLIRAGNMKLTIPCGPEGADAVNNIRAQIDAELARARATLSQQETGQ